MAEFKREERYVVVKLKDIDDETQQELRDWLKSWQVPTCECVVVESDWPIYEQTWDAVQRLAEGRPQRAEELEAERDALAKRINDEDVSQILKLIEDECRYWHGRDEVRRGGYANLLAEAKEIIRKQQPAPPTEKREMNDDSSAGKD